MFGVLKKRLESSISPNLIYAMKLVKLKLQSLKYHSDLQLARNILFTESINNRLKIMVVTSNNINARYFYL